MAKLLTEKTHRALSRLAKISLDIAECVDLRGENEDKIYIDDIGLGYRALSSYLREGVIAITEIEEELHEARMHRKLAEIGEEEAENVLIRIFGSKEVPSFNDDEIRQIKELVLKLNECPDEEG